MSEPQQPNRRDVLKKAIYIAPVILSFPVAPAAARSGSEQNHDYPNKWKEFLEKLKDRYDDKHDHDDKKWKGKGRGGWRDRD